MAGNSLSLNKTFVIFGLAACLLIVTAIVATMPSSGRVEARERAYHGPCRTEEIALDEGYGVSRTVQRRVCDDY